MFSEFMIRAALAGAGFALAAGLLGSFVVWRRMAYFGDATAHAAILGVALALGLSMSVTLGVFAVALMAALAVHALSDRRVSGDSVLGVIAHGALALGLVAVALTPGRRVNLEAYLFGDLLTTSWMDVGIIWLGAAGVGAVIYWRWRKLLTATVSPELAYAAGINPQREQLVLTLLIAALVALGIKVVGALLVTALLIIPAAAARPTARTPETMMLNAVVIAMASAVAGLGLAFRLDTPVGPTIVSVATGAFVVIRLIKSLRPRRG